jgi:hypothetical protein
LFKIVDTQASSGAFLGCNRSVTSCWKQHYCSSVSTTCDRHVENSIAAALSQQLVTGLLKTALLQLCHNSL